MCKWLDFIQAYLLIFVSIAFPAF
ncbi:hypothetical protein AGR6A_Cc60447 [Agrobacterium sp. NCPPB 925]|nr:hypothetical protein AGR6A_Cc60447 [Agrobacterium sp. NCPPB 925]